MVAVIAGACLIPLLGAVVFYKAAFHEAVAVDPFGLYSLLLGTYLVSRFAFSAFYRPGATTAIYPAPRVAIVTPRFHDNEEEAIGKSLRSLLEFDYPRTSPRSSPSTTARPTRRIPRCSGWRLRPPLCG